MSASPPSPRPFGPYLLLRQLSADPLGSVWRAGTEARPRLKPFLTLRLFEGAPLDRKALLAAMESAVEVIDDVKGPTVARGAVFGAVDDLPFAAIEDVPGQPLDVLLRPRTAGDGLPLEHALLVGERVLAALEAARPVEIVTGAPHGFLVPSFVHLSYGGEPRVWGFGLAPGLLPALRDPALHAAYAPYVAPEVLLSARPTTAGDVYSVAALLFEAIVGHPPVPGGGLAAVDAARLAIGGEALPEDVRQILRRGLDPDPARREKDVSALRRDVGRLVHGGPHAANTFNLAFFVEKLFEKAIPVENRQREAEELLGTDRAPARTPAAAPPAAAPAPAPRKDVAGSGSAPRPRVEGTGSKRAPAMVPPERVAARTLPDPPRKNTIAGLPPWLVGGGAAILVAALGVGVWKLRGGGAPPPPAPTPVPTVAPTPPPATPTPVLVGKDDPLFQQAVQERLQEELRKRDAQRLQDQQVSQKKKQAEVERAAEEGRKARDAEEAARAARDRNDRDEALRLAKGAQEARKRADEAAAVAARAAESPAVREGDLVDLSKVDTEPSVLRSVRPEVSPLARTRRVAGTVLLRVLVNEKGQSEEVEVLRDTTPKVGLGETSRTAVLKWTWTPATKEGRKVKTWMSVQVPFVAQ